jgi:hypothetical protein
MSPKTLRILAVVAVAFAVVAILSQRLDRSSEPGSELVGTELLPGLADALGEIDRVEIVSPGDQPLATLSLTDDGWVVAEQDGYPADVARLREVLTALSEARIIEEKTSNPEFYSRLGVGPIESDDAGGTAIRISAADRSFPEVVLGETAGSSYRYARRADQATSVMIDKNPDLQRSSAQWVVPDIIDLRSDRVQRVEISHADGERLVISKAAPEETNFTVENLPEGRELQYASVANVTGNALRELRLEQAARGLPDGVEPEVTSEFRTYDGLVVTVTGYTIDEQQWIRLSAHFDADQALQFATDEIEGSVADEAAAESDDASDEAAEISDRLGPWRFRIAAHQYDQLSRRMDDLLRAPPSESE